MIRLNEEKERTHRQPIKRLSAPASVGIHLSQHLGKIGTPAVKPRDPVLLGQPLSVSDAKVYAPVHASVSGTVTAIESMPHPVLGTSRAVIVQSDGKDTPAWSGERSDHEIAALTPDQIRAIVFEAGIVGMGGASFPTHIKLHPPKPLDALIVNGAECEPFITADERLMMEKSGELVRGIELAARAAAVKKVFIAIEENKPEAIRILGTEAQKKGYTLKVLPSRYPQGGEKQLLKSVLGREIPPGKLPFDAGALVQNVATLYALYEAVYLKKPLFERVVTVTGDALAQPGNFLVRIGTPLKALVDACGPLRQEPAAVICGGPMMGVAQYGLEATTIKSTNAVLVLAQAPSRTAADALCVRCGRCVQECPVGLMPCMISLSAQRGRWASAKAYGAAECIECGVCDYVCPQRRNMVQHMKLAKARMPK